MVTGCHDVSRETYEFKEASQVSDSEIKKAIAGAQLVKNNRGVPYYNLPASFDIEVSSFKKGAGDDIRKRACMYIWQFDINGLCVWGRTWSDWKKWYYRLCRLVMYNDRRLVVYVHNLSYEFQFLCTKHNWENIFARKERKPIKALTVEGMEFRCSYLLSHYSLAKTAELLPGNVHKMVGDLDYHVQRHCETPLTDEELNYCYWDIKIVEMYIRQEIERNSNILNIPMTSTGYVRRLIKDSCYDYQKQLDQTRRFSKLIHSLTLTDEEYKLCKRAYSGGFTHANAYYVGETIKNVRSYDFASSYPAVMLNEMYPMS